MITLFCEGRGERLGADGSSSVEFAGFYFRLGVCKLEGSRKLGVCAVVIRGSH